MLTIGQRIKNRRLELGLSVDELAKRLGKNRATVYRYEDDSIENLPVSVIGPLADVLHCSPAYLMGWEDINPWTSQFLSTLNEIVRESDPDSLEACGLKKTFLNDILDQKTPLTFELACEIVDRLGESFDFMLGRDADRTVESALANEDGLVKEAISLMICLPDDKRVQALEILRVLSGPSNTK